MANAIPTVTLNNGVEMPVLGFGVFQIPAELFFDHRDPAMVSWLNGRAE